MIFSPSRDPSLSSLRSKLRRSGRKSICAAPILRPVYPVQSNRAAVRLSWTVNDLPQIACSGFQLLKVFALCDLGYLLGLPGIVQFYA